MPADDSNPWILGHQPPGWDPEDAARVFEEAKATRRQKHLEGIAERKADREAARRLAKGLSADPTDYPWLTDDGWIDRQKVRPWRRK